MSRKVQHELEEVQDCTDIAEWKINKLRSKSHNKVFSLLEDINNIGTEHMQIQLTAYLPTLGCEK